MKKIVCVLLALSLIALCGCVNTVEQSPVSSTQETTESPTAKVTFPEGFSAVQIAERLEESKVCSAGEFLAQVNAPDSVAEEYPFVLDIANTDERAFALEGYIFPDTYEFYKGEKPASVLSRFLKNTGAKLTDLFYSRAAELDMSMDEIITLASIIQKEAGKKTEMAKVSSVLHNRLKSKDFGKLQCDVTINYINDYVTASPYLDEDTARFAGLYNTYKCTGLPAGAICNPGLDAIKAALYPEDTDYFYFVTDEDDNYYYAQTYSEHIENCKLCGITEGV